MERHSKPSPDIPKWSALLVEAVNKPGMIMKLTAHSITTCAALFEQSNPTQLGKDSENIL
jgi:hypothetical protein